MKKELREKILAYNREKANKTEMAKDLEDLLSKLHEVYALLKPIIPNEVKVIFEKYGYTKD